MEPSGLRGNVWCPHTKYMGDRKAPCPPNLLLGVPRRPYEIHVRTWRTPVVPVTSGQRHQRHHAALRHTPSAKLLARSSPKSNLFRRPRLYLTHSFEGKIARGTALRSRGRSRAKRIFSCAPGRRQILSFGETSRSGDKATSPILLRAK